MMQLTLKPLKSREDLVDNAVTKIITHLRAEIAERGEANLFLSGGSTPGPVYELLSTVSLPWEKVSVGLVDERWVDEVDAGSNAGLVRRKLLLGSAKAATFVPMKTVDDTPKAGQSSVQDAYKTLVTINSLAVLGMGTGGHICSWFPNARGLDDALDPENTNSVQAISAGQADAAGNYPDRMTLTLSALKKCKSLLLLIMGEEKRDVLERAFNSRESDLPVAHLIRRTDFQRLTIMYAA